MTATTPRKITAPSWKQYHPDPFRPTNVRVPSFDPDLDPRPTRPPTPAFDSAAEIRTMAARLRWLCDHDNDAPRYMAESIDLLAYERDIATDIAEDAEHDAETARKEITALETKVEDLESHIGKLIDLIGDMSDALTPDEQDEPENVSAFMEGYLRRLNAWEQYLTDNNLRQ